MEAGGEDLAAELGGEGGAQVLEHDEAYEQRVARGPGRWIEVEEAEFERQVRALGGDGGVDAAGVELEEVELGWIKDCNSTIGRSAKLEGAWRRSWARAVEPKSSARVPEPWRRRTSICQRRSCEVM